MKKANNHTAYYRAAFLVCVSLPLFSLFSYFLMTSLFYHVGSNAATAVLEGEFWGKWLCAISLLVTPVFIGLSFLLEQITLQYRQCIVDKEEEAELLSSEQRRAFYLRQRQAKHKNLSRTPWFHYFFLFGVSLLFFVFGVIKPQLPARISVLKEDIQTYKAQQQSLYTGPLLLVERPIVNGISANPDKRFFYYKSDAGYLRCAAPILKQSELMQLAYQVTYLPNTGTILSISDADGNIRTNGVDASITVPDGYWLYGDLPVPICDEAEGYEALSLEEQRLFDILYSQVLNARTGEAEAPTRSFYLPHPLKKEQFNAVLTLYMEGDSFEKYPMYRYRTDDGRIVRRAYCQRVRSKPLSY